MHHSMINSSKVQVLRWRWTAILILTWPWPENKI